MKITHLITSLEGGGTENFLYQVIRYAPKTHSHDVLFLKKDGIIGDRLRTLGVSPRAVTARLLYQDLRRQKPDVLHTLLYRANQLGRVIGRISGIKRVVSGQRAIDSWQKPWHRYLDSFTLPFCDAVFVNSTAAEQLVRARIKNHPTPRITRISNGVDLERFAIQDRSAARATLQLPQAPAIIGGCLMRLHREKGADYILPFAGKVLPQNPNLHLVVGGVGPLDHELRERAQKEAWGNRLHWLGWVENTPTFYAALNFFWSLSREESFPQSLLEASVMGIPWLAPEIGGVPELIVAGARGILYPAEKLDEAALRVSERLSNDQAAQPLALDRFRQRFSVQEMTARFYNALAF